MPERAEVLALPTTASGDEHKDSDEQRRRQNNGTLDDDADDANDDDACLDYLGGRRACFTFSLNCVLVKKGYSLHCC